MLTLSASSGVDLRDARPAPQVSEPNQTRRVATLAHLTLPSPEDFSQSRCGDGHVPAPGTRRQVRESSRQPLPLPRTRNWEIVASHSLQGGRQGPWARALRPPGVRASLFEPIVVRREHGWDRVTILEGCSAIPSSDRGPNHVGRSNGE